MLKWDNGGIHLCLLKRISQFSKSKFLGLAPVGIGGDSLLLRWEEDDSVGKYSDAWWWQWCAELFRGDFRTNIWCIRRIRNYSGGILHQQLHKFSLAPNFAPVRFPQTQKVFEIRKDRRSTKRDVEDYFFGPHTPSITFSFHHITTFCNHFRLILDPCLHAALSNTCIIQKKAKVKIIFSLLFQNVQTYCNSSNEESLSARTVVNAV